MKIDELLKAIGDIDEKYIAEASEPIVPKWKKYARWAAIAATICVVVGGGTMLALLQPESSGGSKDATVLNESGDTGDIDGVPSGGADTGAASTQETDYAFLFQSSDNWNITYEMKFAIERGGPIYSFENEEDIPKLPFDRSAFSQIQVNLFTTQDGIVENTLLELAGYESKSLSILVNESGQFNECRAEDLHDGVERNGVTIYAYDMSKNMDESDLQVFFTINGEAYSISANNMNYNELGIILDEIIQNGISTDDFDLSKATKKLSGMQ